MGTMLRDLRQRVNPWLAAQRSASLVGSVDISALTRVAELLPDEPGSVAFRLGFGKDETGDSVVRVRVSGRVRLVCQRSLQRFELDVEREATLVLVDESEANETPADDRESLVVREESIRLADLVEEELLLALPLVPIDPDAEPLGTCGTAEKPQPPRKNPFAELRNLKI